ncbi:MAG: glycosyltransferase family 25 protein [Inhella sp.]
MNRHHSMPPIRFINLDRDKLRRERLQAKLAHLGLSAERFPAVLWTALPAAEQDRLYSSELNARLHHLPLAPGEKGCYASHLRLWQWLLDSDAHCAIVLEDDVRLEAGFPAVCAAIEGWTQPWDMIKLIGREGIGKREKLSSGQVLTAGHALVNYRRVPSLTAGYALHRRGAEKLLRHRLPFGRPIDVDLRHWWECEALRVQGVWPAAIALDETSETSSINASLKTLSLAQRWRKFLFKTRYSLANAWYSHHS